MLCYYPLKSLAYLAQLCVEHMDQPHDYTFAGLGHSKQDEREKEFPPFNKTSDSHILPRKNLHLF